VTLIFHKICDAFADAPCHFTTNLLLTCGRGKIKRLVVIAEKTAVHVEAVLDQTPRVFAVLVVSVFN